jgi:hypothetical protein
MRTNENFCEVCFNCVYYEEPDGYIWIADKCMKFDNQWICGNCNEDYGANVWIELEVREKLLKKEKVDKSTEYWYFVTLTQDKKKKDDVEKFEELCVKNLKKKCILEGKYVFEGDENGDKHRHCHALIKTNGPKGVPTIKNNPFYVMNRDWGNVDWKRVKKDHGIEKYMSKENNVVNI